MGCTLAEIVPSSDNTIEVLTGLTPDTETVFSLRNTNVAVLSIPASFEADSKPFRLVIAGKKHATSTSTTGSVRLVLGSSSDLGSDITIDIFANMTSSLDSRFLYIAEGIWDSVTQKVVFATTSIVGNSVTYNNTNPVTAATQSDLNFALFGRFSSPGFDSSDSITITEFRLEAI